MQIEFDDKGWENLSKRVMEQSKQLDSLGNGALAACFGGFGTFAILLGPIMIVPTAMTGAVIIYRIGKAFIKYHGNREFRRLQLAAAKRIELENIEKTSLPLEVKAKLSENVLPILQQKALPSPKSQL